MRTGLPNRALSLVKFTRRSISTDTLANFPYKFRNTKELVKTREGTKEESIKAMNELINIEDLRLKDGFAMAYLALLKGIQEKDALTEIGSFSERTLYREF